MSTHAAPFGAILADFKPSPLFPHLPQRALLDYMAWALAVAQCSREKANSPKAAAEVHAAVKDAVNRYGVSPEHIRQRQACVLPAMEPVNGELRIPEKLTGLLAHLRERPEGPTLDERMGLFRTILDQFLEKHYQASQQPPDDIVHVCTTGYLLPSPVQRMVSARGWDSTVVTHSYHMGCYGTFPAVRTAVGILATGHAGVGAPKSRVDLINTELASLHIDTASITPPNLVTATLFGDGLLTYSAYAEREAKAKGVRGLKVLASHDQIIPNSGEDMKLTPGSQQFDMVLSIRVPYRIKTGILPFVNDLCRKAGIDFEKEKDTLELAIHPGGTKILDVVADSLRVDPKKLDHSLEVLRDHGNMASATIPHVWHRIMQDDSIAAGTKIVTAAFGPGLTVTGMVLQKT